MYKIKAYYHFVFNFDLEGITVLEEDGVKVLNFKTNEQFEEFMNNNHLTSRTLNEEITVAVTPDENVYGKIEQIS